MIKKKKIEKLNAAGSATNAGIDYQQRVGAWFLIAQYTSFQINKTIDIERELFIESIHFETSDSIDDLKIVCDNKNIIYCQIKRCIHSLSESKTSDFYKTIKQFVNEFIANYSEQEYYVLISTSDSLSKLKRDLKKILTSIRLNDSSFTSNPLNSSERETFKKFRTLFFHLYTEITEKTTDETTFIRFCKQVFISIIDLEEGNSNVNAALALLKSANFEKPVLIWKLLISNCLSFASKRQSVNKQFISNLLDQYSSTAKSSVVDVEISGDEKIACGKDIILIESFIEQADYLIIELFRFDDFGSLKLTYKDENLITQAIDGVVEWKVKYRCSSVKGIERYLDENEHLYENKKIDFIPADKSIDYVEEEPYVIAFREKYKDELAHNLKNWNCLHCGKSISSESALLVEVDELGFKHAFGAIHKDCHRTLDRVLGVTGLKNATPKSHLRNFDYKKWISLIIRGQGQINAIKNTSLGDKIVVISYNAEREINDGNFCIRMTLEDKSVSYFYCGHEIERYHKEEGEKMMSYLKNELVEAQKAKDPIYVTNITFNKGRYRDIVKRKKATEKLLKVINYELIKYSVLLSKINEMIDYDYAPICLLYDKETSSIINFDNYIPFISDPLKFDSFYDNWIHAGFKLSDCELKIIESDKDFGIHLMSFFDKGLIPIIDPEFDLQKDVINGYKIVNQYDFINQNTNNIDRTGNFKAASNPKFRKGENVKVVFPNLKLDKNPIGCLLDDELSDESGERYVIFQPIEDGEPLELAYSIPSKLIEKI